MSTIFFVGIESLFDPEYYPQVNAKTINFNMLKLIKEILNYDNSTNKNRDTQFEQKKGKRTYFLSRCAYRENRSCCWFANFGWSEPTG